MCVWTQDEQAARPETDQFRFILTPFKGLPTAVNRGSISPEPPLNLHLNTPRPPHTRAHHTSHTHTHYQMAMVAWGHVYASTCYNAADMDAFVQQYYRASCVMMQTVTDRVVASGR